MGGSGRGLITRICLQELITSLKKSARVVSLPRGGGTRHRSNQIRRLTTSANLVHSSARRHLYTQPDGVTFLKSLI